MQAYLDCVVCLVRQCLDASRMLTDKIEIQEKILRQVLLEISSMSFEQSPPYMALKVHRLIREIAGDGDPYKEAKELFNRVALELYPELKEKIKGSPDPLETAVRLAIAGNIIDFAVSGNLDRNEVEKTIINSLQQPLAINKLPQLREAAREATSILYLGDNAGEVVFDRLLIEELQPAAKITFAVKGHPVINDATMEDAVATGLTQVVKVVSNGSDAPGTILELCSPEFQRWFKNTDLIIAKGQANYETLSEAAEKVYFLLMAKCPVIARDIGCKVGDMVVLHKNRG